MSLELLNLGFEAFPVGSPELIDLHATLVELEGWHRFNATGLGGLGVRIDVDLDEGGVVLHDIGVLLELGRNHLARRTPGSGEVYDDQLVAGPGNLRVKFSFGGELLNHFFDK